MQRKVHIIDYELCDCVIKTTKSKKSVSVHGRLYDGGYVCAGEERIIKVMK